MKFRMSDEMFYGDKAHKELLVSLVSQWYSTRASIRTTWIMFLGSLNMLLTSLADHVDSVFFFKAIRNKHYIVEMC